MSRYTHGHAVDGYKTPEYGVWQAMLQRCYWVRGPSYRNYGARGIRVCDRWRHSFAAFIKDMGKRPSPDLSIDRVDNDGNYEPGNCRWATRAEQAQNRRPTKLITVNGVTKTLKEWSVITGIKVETLRGRLYYKDATPEWSILTPLQEKGQASRKLTAELVQKIKDRYSRGDISYFLLGREFGFAARTVWRAINEPLKKGAA